LGGEDPPADTRLELPVGYIARPVTCPDLEMPPASSWHPLVEAALAEDIGPGDATSRALIDLGSRGVARLEAREALRVCGLELAAEVFRRCGASLDRDSTDGADVEAGQVVATVRGPVRALLTGERTALNFLQRLSGVATLTRCFCDAIAGSRARILDTRKTTPGWRLLEKYAVRCGGGTNHRTGLYDGILIKDNHIGALGSVKAAVERARRRGPLGLAVEVEVESLEQARAALEAGADALLVDNQPPSRIAEIVGLVAGRVPVEASGGVTLETVREIAQTGVDRISVGALTHSARAVDLALEWTERSLS
jgi:nicotinate-nucleotide pyrophosphorylase (carboxylating)